MAYIPSDAKWYLADIVIEITIEDDPDKMVHINITLIRADSPEEAYERSLEVGKQQETTYENTDGKLVTFVFRGLRDLNVIHEELEHGAELTYEELTELREEQVARLIRPKQVLSVFRPRPGY
jgi:hypothetical protein